jgi:hypothetical protein
MKATDVLKKDHDAVKKMFAAFEKMGDKAKEKRAMQAEEYPRSCASTPRQKKKFFTRR